MIFTIGTSNRTQIEFVRELQSRSVSLLVDVRSSPYSRLPWFNAWKITQWATNAGIDYRQMGDVLGGRSPVPVSDPAYADALDKLVRASSRETVAIFCAEGDPAKCHRSWDVGASLLIHLGISAKSILRDGSEEDIIDSLRRVSRRNFHPCLTGPIAEELARHVPDAATKAG